MKIAITGHTAGIGKAVYDLLKDYYQVKGYSLENDFDINKENIRKQIVSNSIDADIFINNAYHIFGQVDLLKKFIYVWQGQKDKIIINIGSDIILDKDYIGLDINYVLSKKKLQEIVLQYNNTFPKICNILPGPIDTKMSEKFDVPKLAPNNVAKFIKLIIENKNNFWIKEVILTSPILESE